MARVLVYSEQDDVAFELLSKARELEGTVSAALLNKSDATDYFAHGAEEVYVGEAPQLGDLGADVVAEALVQVVDASGAVTSTLTLPTIPSVAGGFGWARWGDTFVIGWGEPTGTYAMTLVCAD